MNERIRELAVKSFDVELDRRNFEEFSTDSYGIEKFAQLIVDECVSLYTHDDVMAPVGQSAYGEAYQDGWIEGTKAYRETILEHFGVEL